jgi:hypothetical protein
MGWNAFEITTGLPQRMCGQHHILNDARFFQVLFSQLGNIKNFLLGRSYAHEFTWRGNADRRGMRR